MYHLFFFLNHIDPLWIWPVYKRSWHAGESYNSSQSSGCSHREAGLWENERGDGRCLWPPGPSYRWAAKFFMSFRNVLCSCAVYWPTSAISLNNQDMLLCTLCDLLCLFSVESAFSWCVDGDLLKRNNLISPQDYITTPKPRVEVPADSTLHSLRNY